MISANIKRRCSSAMCLHTRYAMSGTHAHRGTRMLKHYVKKFRAKYTQVSERSACRISDLRAGDEGGESSCARERADSLHVRYRWGEPRTGTGSARARTEADKLTSTDAAQTGTGCVYGTTGSCTDVRDGCATRTGSCTQDSSSSGPS
eukprot:3775700-Rhodomonas_salina.2